MTDRYLVALCANVVTLLIVASLLHDLPEQSNATVNAKLVFPFLLELQENSSPHQ